MIVVAISYSKENVIMHITLAFPSLPSPPLFPAPSLLPVEWVWGYYPPDNILNYTL